MMHQQLGMHSTTRAHRSLLEHKHKALDDMLDMAYNKGDLNDAQSLEFYTASAMAKNNLDVLTDSATAFERVTGEVPRTLMDVASPNFTDFSATKIGDTGMQFVEQLRERIRDSMQWLHFRNSERVRKDIGHKLVAAEKKRTMQTDLREGDMVSYQGNAVKIIELLHQTLHGYSKARIRRVDHDTVHDDTVNYSDLTPIGDHRPELTIKRPLSMEKGKLAFYAGEDGLVTAGKIESTDGSTLYLHQYRQAPKRKRQFTPIFILNTGEEKAAQRKPANAAAKIIKLPTSDIMATTDISSTFMVSQDALPALRSKGVVMDPVIVFPIQRVRTTKEQQRLDMIALTGVLRALAKAMHLNPFGSADQLRLTVYKGLRERDGLNPTEGFDSWNPTTTNLQNILSTMNTADRTPARPATRAVTAAKAKQSPPQQQLCYTSHEVTRSETSTDASTDTGSRATRATLSYSLGSSVLSMDFDISSTYRVVILTMIVYVTWVIMQSIHSLIASFWQQH